MKKLFFLIILLAIFVYSVTFVFAGLDKDLIDAVRDGDLKRVNTLLAKGANVNIKTIEKQTPLDVANKSKVIELLKEHGAKQGTDLE